LVTLLGILTLRFFRHHQVKMNYKVELAKNGLFYVAGSDLRLYKLEDDAFRLKAISTEYQAIRSIQWNPSAQLEKFAAIACNSGKVVVSKAEEIESHWNIATQEEIIKNRGCNVVSWNPQQPEILLTGFERSRGDSGLFFWDLQNILAGGVQWKELNHYGASLAVNSACWLNATSALCGIGFRWIRSFDHRTPNSSLLNIVTKAVYGLERDPFHEHRFVSYSDDSIIQLWDARYGSKSLLSIQSEFKSGINELSFSLVKSNVLSASGKDSHFIRLWHLQDGKIKESKPTFSVGKDHDSSQTNLESLLSAPPSFSCEPTSVMVFSSRSIKPYESNVNHFKWLYSDIPSMIVCHGRDCKIDRFTVPGVKVITWGKEMGIATERSIGSLSTSSIRMKRSDSYESTKSNRLFDDISNVMYRYAMEGYGSDIEKNLEIVQENIDLSSAWKLVENIEKAPFGTFELEGIQYASLGLQQIIQNMDLSQRTMVDLGLGFPLVLYSSSNRDVALSMCGWQYSENHSGFQEVVSNLEYEGDFEKAAGLTFLYYADLSRTIECLNSSRGIYL
jgi:WD repeat-containing protein mio